MYKDRVPTIVHHNRGPTLKILTQGLPQIRLFLLIVIGPATRSGSCGQISSARLHIAIQSAIAEVYLTIVANKV